MIRTARKNEYNSDANDILRMWREDYGHPEAIIRWVPGKRDPNPYRSKMLYRGFWSLDMNDGIDDRTGALDDSPLERAAVIEVCTECGSLHAHLPGSADDDLDTCEFCDAPAE